VNILKGYMESGEFQSRKGEHPRRRRRCHGRQLRRGRRRGAPPRHLFGPMPKEMRDDTAFHDRIHAYLPGWDVPKLDPSYFSDHFGFVSDFLANAGASSGERRDSKLQQGRLQWGSQLSGRDRKAANNTVNGLLKLLWPNPEMEVPDDALSWAAELALELRRRVKEQQASIGIAEFGTVDLSYRHRGSTERVCTATSPSSIA